MNITFLILLFNTVWFLFYSYFLYLLSSSTALITAPATFDISCSSFMLLFKSIQSAGFAKTFPMLPVDVKEFLLSDCNCRNASCLSLVRVITSTAVRQKMTLNKSMLLCSGDVMLIKKDTEQLRQVLCQLLAVHLYAKYKCANCQTHYLSFPWQWRHSTSLKWR